MTYPDFTYKLVTAARGVLEEGFHEHRREEKIVEGLVGAFSGIKGVASSGGSPGVAVDAGFMHGAKSFVVSGIRRELADLLMLSTHLDGGGRLERQAVCFVQVKMQKGGRSEIDSEQLRLLRTFPSVVGYSGLLKGRRVELQSTRGYLGGYSFFSSPGEMSFLTPRAVHQLLGGRKSFDARELGPMLAACSGIGGLAGQWPGFAWAEAFELLSRWELVRLGKSHAPPIESALGIEPFMEAWVMGRVGQSWSLPLSNQADISLAGAVKHIVGQLETELGDLNAVLRGVDADPPPPEEEWADDGWGTPLAVLSAIVRRAE